MREFIALFPAVYLIDNVLFWILLAAGTRWYWPESRWSSFAIQCGSALGIALLFRLRQKRQVMRFGNWLTLPLGDTNLISSVLIVLALVFLGLMGYEDVIELTGAPNNSERFLVGRIRSMLSINIILVGVYSFIGKWRDILTATTATRTTENKLKTSQRNAVAQQQQQQQQQSMTPSPLLPHWLLYLCAVLSLAILVDLFMVQPAELSYILAALLIAFLLLFTLFNACWARRVQKSYKQS